MAAAEPTAQTAPPAAFFKALADESRLTILRLLSVGDLKAGEIVEQLGAPQNAVSYHLRLLRTAGLLRDRHSSQDGRDIYYSLDFDRLQHLYDAAGEALRPMLRVRDHAPRQAGNRNAPWRVLFLCTHNSARSQLAEALLRQHGGAGVEVHSAGSEPGRVHPLTFKLLQEWRIDPRPHRSKPVEPFLGQRFDTVITVCDRMREHCPAFPGSPLSIHWSIPDPLAVPDPAAQWDAFRQVSAELSTRINHLLHQAGVA